MIIERGFNPRTRMGCDGRKPWRSSSGKCGFNPRTRMGCDREPRTSTRDSPSFNPRTRMGCDIVLVPWLKRPRLVSIHAPVWGAT